jgi:hypothetical protein
MAKITLSNSASASVISSLLFPPSENGWEQNSGRLARGLYEMGELLKLGGRNVTEEVKRAPQYELIGT